MTVVVVTGLGLVSALGSRDRTWRKLLNQESAIAMAQPFPDLEPRPLALIGDNAGHPWRDRPADLRDLTRQLVLETLEDAGMAPPLPNLGLAIGSSRSAQGSWETIAHQFLTGDRELPDLSHCLDYLPDLPARIAAQLTGTQGIVQAPMNACNTGMWAIAQGYELIRCGRVQQVLAGAIEAPITPLTLAGFTQMGALAKTGCYPFDRHREGLVLGEGGAFLFLESLESAQQRQASIYGQILGAAFTNDAYHVSAPKPDRTSAAIAIKTCLERAGLTPRAIDYIHAHGTSTPLNDAAESQLIEHLFPPTVPVSSTKGATGHTLGASGALGIAFSLMAMKHEILLPCVGLREPEFNLNLVRSTRSQCIQHSLCLSFAFGGNNGAIALVNSPKQ
ncbi:beta-ketoacyl-ACP synthase [Roseofilum sp. BLCC_M91]|uniref:Beta-ketoacyl-ACP synthase n=1 Tax=Roseofilum halophilum BLCC-M91 TaxID=3022259 RepID=A0ABT7BFE8_9CYAN|nr:beta-ketoacyl-ACP synthase [Roseofilum halophilum]MDJ1177319.1 beta-ketoacyl-ACP synthase [Roseofilum halophilum BLCC-M91]